MACFPPAQMGLASVAHLYVFPAKPYEQATNLKLRNVAVLGDYASVDCPVDAEEVRDSTRPAKPKHPQSELEEKYATSIKSSIWDFLFGGGQYVSFLTPLFFFSFTRFNAMITPPPRVSDPNMISSQCFAIIEHSFLSFSFLLSFFTGVNIKKKKQQEMPTWCIDNLFSCSYYLIMLTGDSSL